VSKHSDKTSQVGQKRENRINRKRKKKGMKKPKDELILNLLYITVILSQVEEEGQRTGIK
jgi:hypothetical protein